MTDEKKIVWDKKMTKTIAKMLNHLATNSKTSPSILLWRLSKSDYLTGILIRLNFDKVLMIFASCSLDR